jgi:hypothetical protein
MNSYTELSKNDSIKIHKSLLREPDENIKLCSKKILGFDEKTSLPMAFEFLLIDKTPKQILEELLEYYCKTSVIQYSNLKDPQLKRKSSEKSKRTKKVKKS